MSMGSKSTQQTATKPAQVVKSTPITGGDAGQTDLARRRNVARQNQLSQSGILTSMGTDNINEHDTVRNRLLG